MNYKDVLNKDSNRFCKVNEQVNFLAEKYGMKTAVKMVKNRLNEEGEVQQPQQPQQQQPVQIDYQKMIGDFRQVGQAFQKFAQEYQNSPYANDLLQIFNSLKAVGGKMQQDMKAQQPQQPQQPQQQAQNQQQ